MRRIKYGIAKVYSWDELGQSITLEVSLMPGLPRLEFARPVSPGFITIRERLRAAFRSAEMQWPACRMVADISGPKTIQGETYDFPMAIAILMASGQIPEGEFAAKGELRLDGTVWLDQKNTGLEFSDPVKIFAPLEEGVTAVGSLQAFGLYWSMRDEEREEFLRAELEALKERVPESKVVQAAPWDRLSIDQLYGQDGAHRALQLALSGKHDVFLEGSPGCGKSSLVWAYARLLADKPLRSPKPSVTLRRFLGGGPQRIRGEVVEAHGGILYLEELYLYRKEVLDHLTGVLDHRQVLHVSRTKEEIQAADILLIATGNPCPCGYKYDNDQQCCCSLTEINRYRSRVRAPLHDRLTLHVEMHSLATKDLPRILQRREELDPTVIRERIEASWQIQAERMRDLGYAPILNARLPKEILDHEAVVPRNIARKAALLAKHYQLTARSYLNLLRLSRTIADLSGDERLAEDHLFEAALYLPRLSEGEVA